MIKSFLMMCALLVPAAAHADRISRMNPTERCTYTAQLKVAAYYYFEQGKARDEIQIKWHGDETPYEMDFVNATIAQAYEWLERWKQTSSEMLPAHSFGDMVYQTCMGERNS